MSRRFFLALAMLAFVSASACADDEIAAQPGILRAAEVAWRHFSSVQPPENNPCDVGEIRWEDIQCYIFAIAENAAEFFVLFTPVASYEGGVTMEGVRAYQIDKQDFHILMMRQVFARDRKNWMNMKTSNVQFPASGDKNTAPLPGFLRAVETAYPFQVERLVSCENARPDDPVCDIRNFVIFISDEDTHYSVDFSQESGGDGNTRYRVDRKNFRILDTNHSK
jgi:hypothetical protein